MPRVDPALFSELLREGERRGADAVLLASRPKPFAGPKPFAKRDKRSLEPLLAVYRGTCRSAVAAALQAGERRMVAFHRGFGKLDIAALSTAELPLALEAQDSVRNLNTPADFTAEGGTWR